jgi:hypothetical protein
MVTYVSALVATCFATQSLPSSSSALVSCAPKIRSEIGEQNWIDGDCSLDGMRLLVAISISCGLHAASGAMLSGVEE